MLARQQYKNTSLKHLFSTNFDIPFQKNKLHEICSYIAMYPAELVHKLINHFLSHKQEFFLQKRNYDKISALFKLIHKLKIEK